MDLDQDPHTIVNWEEYAQGCINSGEMWRFRKALSDYIFWVTRPLKAELNEYIRRRQGEWMMQDLDDQVKRKKPRTPNVNRKFV